MSSPLASYYIHQPEPNGSALLALRQIILNYDPAIKEVWKFKTPFFTFNDKNLCYFNVEKKTNRPYIGVIIAHKINHPALHKGDRKQIEVLYIDPLQDIPVALIYEILSLLKPYYLLN